MNAMFSRHEIVRFGWCDFAGIMFFPRYFELANDTVEAWFGEALGITYRQLHGDLGWSVPTVRFDADFKAPSRMDDRLTIDLVVEQLGGASCTLKIAAHADGQLRFFGRQVIVLTDRATLRPRPWPDDLRARIAPFIEEPA
ncbi:MAG: acyl-CoA thioesterase [Caulobacteraceae bacterium]|nr:acyl-CoA thioesterase [Caulobacteraceae bacterium]